MEKLRRIYSKISVAWNNNKLISVVGILILIAAIYFIHHLSEHTGNKQEFGIPYLNETQFVAGIITILSIIFVIATLLQSKSLYEADLLVKFDEKYESREMSDNLRLLRNISSLPAFGDVRHLVRSDMHNEDKPLPLQIKGRFWSSHAGADEARRAVKFYFINALDLYLEGKISQKIMRRICNKSGITILFNVVEPMEAYLNPKYDYTKFRLIMMLTTDIWREHKKTDDYFASDQAAASTTKSDFTNAQTLNNLIHKMESLENTLKSELASLNHSIRNVEDALRTKMEAEHKGSDKDPA